MKKIASFNNKVFIIALVLAGLCMLLASSTINRKEVKHTTNIFNEEFGREHFQYIMVDTFIAYLYKGYGNHVTVSTEGRQLHVSLRNAGIVTKDFFNSNDKLLKLKLNDFGFSIKYNKVANEMMADFDIKNGAVPVPNDVLIKLVDKTINK